MDASPARARKLVAACTALSVIVSLCGCTVLVSLQENANGSTPSPSPEMSETSRPLVVGPQALTEDSGFPPHTRIVLADLPEGWSEPETTSLGAQTASHEGMASETRFCSLESSVIRFGHQRSLTTDDILTEDYVAARFIPEESDHTELLSDETLWISGDDDLNVEVRALTYATEYLDMPSEGYAAHLLRGYAPRNDRARWHMLATLECRTPLGIPPLSEEEFAALLDEVMPSLTIQQGD